MQLKSEASRGADKAARTELLNSMKETFQFIKAHGNSLPDVVLGHLQDTLDCTLDWFENNELDGVDEFKAKKSELERVTFPILAGCLALVGCTPNGGGSSASNECMPDVIDESYIGKLTFEEFIEYSRACAPLVSSNACDIFLNCAIQVPTNKKQSVKILNIIESKFKDQLDYTAGFIGGFIQDGWSPSWSTLRSIIDKGWKTKGKQCRGKDNGATRTLAELLFDVEGI